MQPTQHIAVVFDRNYDNFSLNGVCTDVTIRQNVLGNLYNGGVFMLGVGL